MLVLLLFNNETLILHIIYLFLILCKSIRERDFRNEKT